MRSLRMHWLSLFAAAAFWTGCQTAPERPPTLVVPPPAPGNAPQPQAPTLTTNDVLALIAEMDSAFAHDNCARVNEIAATLRISATPKVLAGTPTATAAAVSLCDSLLSPRDTGKAKTAAKVLADAAEGAGPVVDKAWVERMRADRLLAARQEDKALAAKKKERELLAAQAQRMQILELDIYELSNATSRLSTEDKAQLRRYMANAQNDSKLFDALRGIDEILARTQDPAAKAALVNERSRIVARVEQLFAVDVAQLEDKLASKREAEARAQAQEIKKRFPTRSYEMRVDAIMGDATPAPSGTAVGSPENDSSHPSGPGALDAPVTEATLLEKSLADARAAMNSGDPAGAVNILDGIPEKERTEKVRRLRKDAAELHIKELRTRVREVYNRASSQPNKQLKLDALKQCKEILELILSRYPDTSSRPGVERNLKSINSEIEFISKGS